MRLTWIFTIWINITGKMAFNCHTQHFKLINMSHYNLITLNKRINDNFSIQKSLSYIEIDNSTTIISIKTHILISNAHYYRHFLPFLHWIVYELCICRSLTQVSVKFFDIIAANIQCQIPKWSDKRNQIKCHTVVHTLRLDYIVYALALLLLPPPNKPLKHVWITNVVKSVWHSVYAVFVLCTLCGMYGTRTINY